MNGRAPPGRGKPGGFKHSNQFNPAGTALCGKWVLPLLYSAGTIPLRPGRALAGRDCRMKVLYYAAAVGCALSLVDRAAARADQADEQQLQGKWNVESFEYNGNPVERLKDAVREIKDSKYSLTPKTGEGIEGTLKIDATQKPKTIDLDVNGRILKGIYELDGDMLKFCYNLSDSERPTEFVSKPDSGLIVVVHKRAK